MNSDDHVSAARALVQAAKSQKTARLAIAVAERHGALSPRRRVALQLLLTLGPIVVGAVRRGR